MKLYQILIMALGLLTGGQALASDFTLNIHTEGKAASKQYCITDFEIDLDGNWTARSMYSNGQQISSVRFYSVLTVKAKDGRSVITIPQNHHVKGSGGGRAREERTSESGQLPEKVVKMISKANADYSCRIVSDLNFNNLQKIITVATWVLSL